MYKLEHLMWSKFFLHFYLKKKIRFCILKKNNNDCTPPILNLWYAGFRTVFVLGEPSKLSWGRKFLYLQIGPIMVNPVQKTSVGQHLALSYVFESGVPILYHES